MTPKDALPVEALREDVLAARLRGPLVLTSPTGSGKSTQLPRWCPGRTLVVEPRRVACRSLAQRVAELEGTELGGAVGYHVRDERRADADTRVVFATPGIVLRRLDDLPTFDTVILDELHERGLEIDLLLALLLRRHRAGTLGAALVAMSATLDGPRVARHLGGVHLHAEGRLFPVEVFHRGDGVLLPNPRDLERRVAAAVDAAADHPGDILVFLPGKGEIERCRRTLERPGLDVLPLHGGLSLDQQSRVFRPSSRRRLILTTNVAETSLTVPGIGVVIDSGLVRQTRYHRGRGFLTLMPVARDSAEQRAGRAGRIGPGVAFRLWSEEAPLEARTAPEILRESLVPLVLAASSAGVDAGELPYLDAPKDHALETARGELQSLGALDPLGRITERGRRLFGLPLDPLLGRLLVEAEASGEPALLHDMIDLAAALAARRPLSPGTTTPELLAHAAELDASEPALCDAVAILRTLRGAGAETGHGGDGAGALRRRLRAAFGVTGPAPGPDAPIDRRRLAHAVLAADRRVAHVARRRGRGFAWSNGGTEIVLSKHSRVAAALAEGAEIEAVAVLGTVALGLGGRDVRTLATHALPLPLKWLTEAGLGVLRLGRIDVRDGEVVARLERTYAGKVIARRDDIPRGDLARDAVATLLLEGRLFRKTFLDSRDAHERAALVRRLAGADGERPWWLDAAVEHVADLLVDGELPGLRAWVEGRLRNLGFEAGDDLPLLSPDDLRFPDLPEALRAELDRNWPRRLTISGVVYRIDYDLAKNDVLLRLEQGKPRVPPDPFFLPRFPGFRVRVEHKGVLRTLRG
ncbi:MAG: helicase-related protein [Acidobacteriota bacterium]